MTGAEGPTRREVLGWVGGAGVTALLAGCTPGAPSVRGAASASPATPAPLPPSTSGFDALSARLSSRLLRPGSSAYASHVRLYNPRFDATRHPAAIAACHTTADVVACVRFAAEGGTPLHLRAGGHSYGGWSSGPGLVADVSAMSSVVVDPAAGTVRVGAGVGLAALYGAIARRGVAIAAGSCPTVGLTGLALGGGVGVLTRAFGLTCDALRSMQVVTADGQVREVDAQHEPDLYWALRGGGGSFGAVTALTLEVRPAPTVHTFFLSWRDSHAQAVLEAWQHWMGGADAQLWSSCKLLADPGRGGLRAVVAGTWVGKGKALDGQLAPLLRGVGAPPQSEQRRTLGYARAMLLEAGCSGKSIEQCTTDALAPAERQPFSATSAIVDAPLPSAGTSAAVDSARTGLDVPQLVEGGTSFDALGGAVADIAPADTAFVHRRSLATVQYTATWASGSRDPAPFDAHVRGQRAALAPWTGTAAYVNYADPAITDHGPAYWGTNYPRLQAIKKQYDPDALFTFPQAVQP